MNNLIQIALNGLTLGSTYGVLGLSFGLVYFYTGRFHFAFGSFYTLAAFVGGWAASNAGVPIPLALIAGVLASVVGGLACEVLVYRPLEIRAPNAGLFGNFIAALAIVLLMDSTVSLVWRGSPLYFLPILPLKVFHIGSATLTNLAVIIIVTSWAIILVSAYVLRFTQVGRLLRGLRVNPSLTEALGMRPRRLILGVFAVSSAFGGIMGLLYAAQYAAQVGIGDTAVLNALVVAFLARALRPIGIGLVGIVLGVGQSIIVYWSNAVVGELFVFGVLFVVIAATPYLRTLRRRQGRGTAGRSVPREPTSENRPSAPVPTEGSRSL